MLHNEDVYPDPFTFNPDRFIKDGEINRAVRDPAHAAFGFGRRYLSSGPLLSYLMVINIRRICPGRFMAYNAVWIAIASILATFDITKAIDENGHVIEPSHEYMSALVV